MISSVDSLLGSWRSSGVVLNPGASVSQLAATAKRLGASLPSELHELLLACNGMPSNEWDPRHTIRWMPTDEWFQLNGEPGWQSEHSRGAWVFADYLLGSHFYAIKLGLRPENSQVFVLDDRSEKLISSTFLGFLRLYLFGNDTAIFF